MTETQGHVGEGEAPWVVSHYESGNLAFTPDSSLPQWTAGPRMLSFDAADGVEMRLMSVNNGSYVVFLVQRTLNTSLSDVWVIIAFEGQGVNGSDQVWFWTSSDSGSSPIPGDAKDISGILVGSELTVVFARPLNPGTSDLFTLKVGVPYDDFVKVTSWSNGTSVNDLDLDALTHMGLEIFPFQDHYPKAPLVYGAIILVATFLFLFSELRKYRGV